MKKIKLLAGDRGVLENYGFQGFALFDLGERGTKRPGNFGPLYVFNDDTMYPGSFLGMHPHSNVDIVTVMIAGEESHEDTLGIHEKYITGDVQLISAGSGIRHSGGNTSSVDNARHLQIWIQPAKFNTIPRVSVLTSAEKNHQPHPIKLLVSPDAEKGSLQIDQQIWISEITFDAAAEHELFPRSIKNGIMLYVIDGETAYVNEEILKSGDTLFVSEWDKLNITVKDTTVKLIAIETELTSG
jgi:redox-sensitive bicupin YhaK (pirin superfamily)